ncbi:hypothetical protein NDU88_007063 [Pleurodeles waltl]|uniref:Uncharacterized protein n=1 Tax=Pleurodeles waltl TaxID=8319 RepID=A0AAV7MHW2_PLEWA|nr:hypothetical protein NDU88_007063 [Pleurodeles waltl]
MRLEGLPEELWKDDVSAYHSTKALCVCCVESVSERRGKQRPEGEKQEPAGRPQLLRTSQIPPLPICLGACTPPKAMGGVTLTGPGTSQLPSQV